MPPFVAIDYTRAIVVVDDADKKDEPSKQSAATTKKSAKAEDDDNKNDDDDEDDDEEYGPLDVSPDDMLLLREWYATQSRYVSTTKRADKQQRATSETIVSHTTG